MILKDYPKILAANDGYSTNPSGKNKIFSLLPSLNFYANVIRIVFYCWLKAKRKVYDDFNWVASSLDILRSLEKCGIQFEIKGMKNIVKDNEPVIFISNHMSTLETFVLPSIIHPVKPVVFVVKKELTTYPFFGPINNARNPVVVGRKNPREDLKIVFEEGAMKLREGKSIIIFPQRTRKAGFEEAEFNTLGIKLAKKNNVKVIPIALVTDAWANGRLVKDFGKIDPSKKVYIEMGEPIEVRDTGMKEHGQVIDFIKSRLVNWGRTDLISNFKN